MEVKKVHRWTGPRILILLCSMLMFFRVGFSSVDTNLVGISFSQENRLEFLWKEGRYKDAKKTLSMFLELLGARKKDLWVNLRADLSEVEILGRTLLGADVGYVLVDADLKLKKIASEVINELGMVEEVEGKSLRFWIVLDKVDVSQRKNELLFGKIRLKVECEENGKRHNNGRLKRVISVLNDIVNNSEDFAQLRLIFKLSVIRWWVFKKLVDLPDWVKKLTFLSISLRKSLTVERRYRLRWVLDQYVSLYKRYNYSTAESLAVSGGVGLATEDRQVNNTNVDGKYSEKSCFEFDIKKLIELAGENIGEVMKRLSSTIGELMDLTSEAIKEDEIDVNRLRRKRLEMVVGAVVNISQEFLGLDVKGSVWGKDRKLIDKDNENIEWDEDDIKQIIDIVLREQEKEEFGQVEKKSLSFGPVWQITKEDRIYIAYRLNENPEVSIFWVKKSDNVESKIAGLLEVLNYLEPHRAKHEKMDKEIEKKNKEIEQLKKNAVTDQLTGLYDKGFLYGSGGNISFEKKIYSSLKRGILEDKKRVGLSVIMIDLDNFKLINDTLGHQMGDEVLKKVSEILQGNIREGEDYAIRWGGDEFMVILPGTSLDNAEKVAGRIREAIEKEVTGWVEEKIEKKIEIEKEKRKGEISKDTLEKVEEQKGKIGTSSIGVTYLSPKMLLFLGPKASIECLEKRADKMVYRCKNEGKNMVSVYDEKNIYELMYIPKVEDFNKKDGEEFFRNLERIFSKNSSTKMENEINEILKTDSSLENELKQKITNYAKEIFEKGERISPVAKAIMFTMVLRKFNVVFSEEERENDPIMAAVGYAMDLLVRNVIDGQLQENEKLSPWDIFEIGEFRNKLFNDKDKKTVVEDKVGGILLSCFN